MKLLSPISLAIVVLFAVQVLGEEENPIKEAVGGFVDRYNKAFDGLKQSVKEMGENAKEGFKKRTDELSKKFEEGLDSIRSRRSAELEPARDVQPESPQSPLDDIKHRAEGALDLIGNAYEKLKTRVNNSIHNIKDANWEEVQGSILNQYDKFKDTITDAKNTLKSSIHNFTAPVEKESDEH